MAKPEVSYTNMNAMISIIQFEFDGAPLSLIQAYLLEAAQELATACVGTMDLQIEGNPLVNDYDFSHMIPDNMEVFAVPYIMVCGECLYPYDKCDPCPNGWSLLSPTCIRVKPCPPEGFTVCVVLQPTEACSQLPDCFGRHRRYFHHYVAGRLAMMENETWGSRSLAIFHRRKADGLRQATAVRETRGNTNAHRSNDGAATLI